MQLVVRHHSLCQALAVEASARLAWEAWQVIWVPYWATMSFGQAGSRALALAACQVVSQLELRVPAGVRWLLRLRAKGKIVVTRTGAEAEVGVRLIA